MHYIVFTFWIIYGDIVFSGNHNSTDHDTDLKLPFREDLEYIMAELNWMQFAVIYDEDNDHTFQSPSQQMLYKISNTNGTAMLEDIHNVMFPVINIVLLLQKNMLLQTVKQINNFDTVFHGTTDFRHHSKLIIILKDVSVLEHLEVVSCFLENVAVIAPPVNCSECVHKREMYTLHIHPDGRKFASISDLKTPNSTVTEQLFPNTQFGYNGRRLVVSSLHSVPYIIEREINETVTFEGYAMDIWKAIANVLNFSFVVTEPADKSWGIQDDKGNWDGLVQQLIAKEIDVAVADLTVEYARAQHIDYIYPVIKVDTTDILYKKFHAYENYFYRIAKPLNKMVYFVIGALFIWTLLFYFLIENRNDVMGSVASLTSTVMTKLPDLATNFFGSALRQGFQQRCMPGTSSGRILLVSWCLFVLIETAMYSGNLVASFSTDIGSNDISSIDELVDSDYTVGTFTITVAYVAVQESKRPEIQRLYKKMLAQSQNDDGIFNNDDAAQIRRMKEQKHAYLSYRSVGEALAYEDCMFDMVGESVTWAEERMTFGITKGSPLKRDIDQVMTMLDETGMLNVWWKKWTSGGNSSMCNINRTAKAITLLDVGGVFLIVFIGIALSVIVLFFECGKNKRWRSRRC